jgi:hypothetical protein
MKFVLLVLLEESILQNVPVQKDNMITVLLNVYHVVINVTLVLNLPATV